jgi:hypothetical protein
MKAPRVVTFAQPIEKIADRERGQHARDGYANVYEQIDENERNAAVDIHDRPKPGHRATRAITVGSSRDTGTRKVV